MVLAATPCFLRPLAVAARRQRRPLRRLVLLGAACAALAFAMLVPCCSRPPARGGFEAFAAFAAPFIRKLAVQELARGSQTAVVEPGTRVNTETEEEGKAAKNVEGSENSTDFNITLQLGDGFPGDGTMDVDMGPSWVMCHVMYADRSARDDYGSVVPRTILEEWAMKGWGEHVSAFKNWRQQTLGVEADMRCATATQQAIEELKCLACVPRSSALPLTPTGHLSEAQPGPLTNSYVLTIGGVDQCLAGFGGGASFCMSGSVAVSM